MNKLTVLEIFAGADGFLSPDRVRLDLHGLSFVDADGVQFLEGLIRDGASVIACSAFVAELLRLEGR